mmetsp:Transcript_19163/g.24863  ORF Transcript_19163/g.24863 Transcript_19163/m.24863 type:complete len:215 (+) Transcript_19163:33-677(+)
MSGKKKGPVRMIPFGAAFPGLIISTLYFCLAAVEFGIACTGVKGNAVLVKVFFAGPLPVISAIKAFLPFTLPSFLVILLKDAYGMLKEAKVSSALGVLQLITLGIITKSVNKYLLPAIQAIGKDDSESLSPDQATDLYVATAIMLFLNTVMLIAGTLKLYLIGSLIDSSETTTGQEASVAAPEKKKAAQESETPVAQKKNNDADVSSSTLKKRK